MPIAMIKKLAKKSNKPVEEVERLWNKAKEITKKKGLENPEIAVAYTLGILKNMLSIKESEEEFKLVNNKLYYKFNGSWITGPKAYFKFRKQHDLSSSITDTQLVNNIKKFGMPKTEAYDDLNSKYRIRSEPKNSASKIFKRDEYIRQRKEKDKKNKKRLSKIDTKLNEIKNSIDE